MCQSKLKSFLAFPELFQHISYRRERGFSNGLPSTASSWARHYNTLRSVCAFALVSEKKLKNNQQAPGATGANTRRKLNAFLLTVAPARLERNSRKFHKICWSAGCNW